ncbi:MAG: hypothetical protein A3C62_02220 [Candidatus Zambryskibacteria bacterium RIFCSPHIGHO2_02_FULL_39_16]|nr:MAG: hypothetical protein A3C62_02220 [Candidatus Zambryskibacteria bacterium RIFCSPHIGHO2_02_FULL_39_16]
MISKNFEDLEISDVLENIKLLLNYTRKKKLKGASLMRRRARERVGGSSAHTKQNDRPELVSKISHLQKIFGFGIFEPHPPRPANSRKPFTTLRGAPRRA